MVNCTSRIDALSEEIKNSLQDHLKRTARLIEHLQAEISLHLQHVNSGEVVQAVRGLQTVTSQLMSEHNLSQIAGASESSAKMNRVLPPEPVDDTVNLGVVAIADTPEKRLPTKTGCASDCVKFV